ncbi:lariat debranching enzyme-like [Capsicum chacoense]|uniref:lariat debranching enzyme-like n=1 Tax=Capsicum annuum TaxID=4072 RepID=UPI001FB179D1|nr:lariat debranching enzyme-like [Capsicum annuum]
MIMLAFIWFYDNHQLNPSQFACGYFIQDMCIGSNSLDAETPLPESASTLEQEIHEGTFGREPAAELPRNLKPCYWFSGHMHSKFAASVKHDCDKYGRCMKFSSLDKCISGRKFLQFVRNKLQRRGLKAPLEFVQTSPCYNPNSQPVAKSVFHERRDLAVRLASFVLGCSYSEDIPLDDVDDTRISKRSIQKMLKKN